MSYSSDFLAALELAHELHRHQRRKGGDVPYVTHLLAVAAIVGESGGTETEVVAALLHDAVEDQGGPRTLARIRDAFGDDVAAIVDGCSDTDVEPKPPWRARKQAYIDAMETAEHSVLLVSAADKLHNARCTLQDLRLHGAVVWERFSGKRDGTLWYYETITAVFRRRLDAPLVTDLSDVVRRLADEG